MKPKSIAIIGIVAAIAIFFIVMEISVVGLCFFGGCDDEIEITAVDYPKLVSPYQWFLVDFTINNFGNDVATNCILHFVPEDRIVTEILSSPFTLFPGEKSNIVLEFHGFAKAGKIFKIENEMIMTAWISCDDVESHRIQFKTFVFDASAEEAIEDFLTSENP
ncbi:MAG: hypothetical protein OEW78_04995 [Nitrosopumilus sp.]|uniref:hypothetical protein n=1 Tax=Nitrosopumilus sp. TaxID=2024843 RepID=UPI00246EDFF7|nr:hypothetical protein [Nitrosopumilus sp.]MDH5431224.1 hypothetical protein [Nitrosopumilus sp.]